MIYEFSSRFWKKLHNIYDMVWKLENGSILLAPQMRHTTASSLDQLVCPRDLTKQSKLVRWFKPLVQASPHIYILLCLHFAFFVNRMVGNSPAAILITLSLFIFPAEIPKVFPWKKSQGTSTILSASVWRYSNPRKEVSFSLIGASV